ncbi:flagellar basal body-associated FliL family protein [Acidovorax sp. NCPPB 2350]|nr:flagellar basal body-associated FliL family protein [Acidovorax sp. NCPPB 2350]
MKKKRRLLTLVLSLLGAVVLLGGGAGAAWWFLRHQAAPAPADAATAVKAEAAKPKAEKISLHEAKYVSMDKVIVMLRSRPDQPLSHYLSVDLVFKTGPKAEKAVKEQLPALRSIAVRFLSTYTMEQASMATVDELTTAINRAYEERYRQDGGEMPFAEVLIGKLIIE